MKTKKTTITIEQARDFSKAEMLLIQAISALPLIQEHEDICTAYLPSTDEDDKNFELLQSVMKVRFSIFNSEEESKEITALITAFGMDEDDGRIEVRLNQRLLNFVIKK